MHKEREDFVTASRKGRRARGFQATLGFRASKKGEVGAFHGGLGAEWTQRFWCKTIQSLFV